MHAPERCERPSSNFRPEGNRSRSRNGKGPSSPTQGVSAPPKSPLEWLLRARADDCWVLPVVTFCDFDR